MLNPDTTTQVRAIARAFIERANHLGFKGKKRDDAALEYFVGAATMASVLKQTELVQHLSAVIAVSVSLRGFKGVQDLAEMED